MPSFKRNVSIFYKVKMTSTVDQILTNLQNSVDKYKKFTTELKDPKYIKFISAQVHVVSIIQDDIDKIDKFVNVKLANLLLEYNVLSVNKRQSCYVQILSSIKANDIEASILNIRTKSKAIIELLETYCDIDSLNQIVAITDNNLNVESKSLTIEHRCNNCSGQQIVDPHRHCLICLKCSCEEFIIDEQYEISSTSITKTSDYHSLSQCIKWIYRIQGKERINIPDALIELLKNKMVNERISIESLDICTLRVMLKSIKTSEINGSTFNPHIVKIKSIITGNVPSSLTIEEEKELISNIDRIIMIFNDIKRNMEDTTKHVPYSTYHPYFIYKLIDKMLPQSDSRKTELLSNIYLQKSNTQSKNDKLWKQISERM